MGMLVTIRTPEDLDQLLKAHADLSNARQALSASFVSLTIARNNYALAQENQIKAEQRTRKAISVYRGQILGIKQIAVNPSEVVAGERFRKDNEVDEEFLESIRDKGILQPITVTPDLRAGSWGKAVGRCVQLNLPEVPCLVREVSDELDLRECELIENAFKERPPVARP